MVLAFKYKGGKNGVTLCAVSFPAREFSPSEISPYGSLLDAEVGQMLRGFTYAAEIRRFTFRSNVWRDLVLTRDQQE
jgi:hypothetical protein